MLGMQDAQDGDLPLMRGSIGDAVDAVGGIKAFLAYQVPDADPDDRTPGQPKFASLPSCSPLSTPPTTPTRAGASTCSAVPTLPPSTRRPGRSTSPSAPRATANRDNKDHGSGKAYPTTPGHFDEETACDGF